MLELALIAGVFGLLIGSFLNVCISRLPNDESVTIPRSYCPRCGAAIASYDNIPLISYLVLGGRCRRCRTPISVRYPLVELLTGAAFFLAVFTHGWSWAGFKLALFAALLIELIVSDIETRILPDEFTLWGTLLGIFLSPMVLLPGDYVPLEGAALRSLGDALAGGLFLAGTLWAVGSLYLKIRGREGLGFGDVKLVLMTGAFLGLRGNLFVLVIGSALGAVLGLAWIGLTRKDPARYELPFGLFLGIAALLVAFLDLGFPVIE